MSTRDNFTQPGLTVAQVAAEHEYKVLQALAHTGWSRPEELVDWTDWPGASAVAMARRTMEKMAGQGLLLKRRIEGKGNGNAYLLAAAGTARCASLGLQVQGKGKDLQIGARWHEHVLAMHVLNSLRRQSYHTAFARQLAWAPPPRGQSKASGLRELGPFRYAKPIKSPDAAAWRRQANGSVTAITIEIEWSRKSGPKRRKQARSILDQVRSTDTFVFIAYPYPPALMGEFLRARQPAGPCPRTLNHERDWRAALNAQGAEPEDLLRIYFVRLEVTSRLELQQVQWFKADKINLDVKQPGGNLYEAIGTVNQVWQCLGQWDPTNTFEGSTWLHLATGFTLKICAAFPVDAISPGYELCAHLRPWNRREVEDQDVDDMACEIYEEWRANGAARRECFPHTPSLLRDFETDARFATLWFEKQIPALQALQRKWISEAIDMAWKQDEARFN